ncbi:hypothetical protein L208DRAFT_1376270 [Tricholoma matsutake]|nr:hypothetical protein L208DRAFT_1376270 [Tricholoma matsutake 945]
MVGGLSNEDVLSVWPQFEKRKQGPVNVVITSVSNSDDSGNESMPVPAECKPIAKMGKFKVAIVPKVSNCINAVKSQAVEPPSALIKQIKSAQQFTDLPLLFRSLALVKQFCTTCYHAWMASVDHFDGCSFESDHLLKIVCEAFKKTFPEVQYNPVRKDVFHHTIYNNLQTLRSNLARAGLGTVVTYLSEMSKQEVKEWVVWTRAACLGELVYKEPCPPGYSLVKGLLNFKKPKGLLMMPFVISLTEPYLKYMHSSLINYGHPHGLIALILVSNGEYKDPGPFNSEHKALLTKYIESVDAFNKWAKFYQACKFTKANSESGVLTADVSQTDIGRRALNFSSSSIKE